MGDVILILKPEGRRMITSSDDYQPIDKEAKMLYTNIRSREWQPATINNLTGCERLDCW